MSDLIERRVFGGPVTQLVYVAEVEGTPAPERVAAGQRAHVPSLLRPKRNDLKAMGGIEQLSLFGLGLDYAQALREAIATVSPIPPDVRYQQSRYVVRVLWALEVAFRAGLGPMRATDIYKILHDYGEEDATLENVAKFFREQKHRGKYTHFWKEGPEGHYRISNAGRDMIASVLQLPTRVATNPAP